mmetsp:Transcript_85919/g.125716  ORF Transcript_85919/g.125716 Transcript_85919/m.125716 type:complete len:138 (-) Transcript_85919:319-732(-)
MASRHDAHVMQRGLPSTAPISSRVLLSLSPHVAPRTYCRCILYTIFIFIHHTQDCCGVFGLYGVGQEANRIGAHIMGQARIGILDVHAVTHGREDRSHDGTHYWNQKELRETQSKVRKGNGVSYTASQLLLNWLCNP